MPIIIGILQKRMSLATANHGTILYRIGERETCGELCWLHLKSNRININKPLIPDSVCFDCSSRAAALRIWNFNSHDGLTKGVRHMEAGSSISFCCVQSFVGTLEVWQGGSQLWWKPYLRDTRYVQTQ